MKLWIRHISILARFREQLRWGLVVRLPVWIIKVFFFSTGLRPFFRTKLVLTDTIFNSRTWYGLLRSTNISCWQLNLIWFWHIGTQITPETQVMLQLWLLWQLPEARRLFYDRFKAEPLKSNRMLRHKDWLWFCSISIMTWCALLTGTKKYWQLMINLL